MINISSIKSDLFDWLGWRQPADINLPTISAANLATDSGRYWDEFHPLVTIEHLYNTLPQNLTDDQFNTELAKITRSASVKVVNRWLSKKRPQVKGLMDERILYQYENTKEDAITLDSGMFVGFEIDPCKVPNLRVALDQVGLYFNANDSFSLYLFHSGQSTAIASQTVTPVANTEAWQSLTDFDLDYYTSTYAGGKFYVGYKTDDLTASPLNREWDKAGWQSITNYVGITPISVSGYSGTSMFEPDDVDYESDTFGLNFKITTKPDYTRFILTQKYLFTDALGYQVARDCLELFRSSTRRNELKQEVRDIVSLELDRVEEHLTRSINDLHIDTTGVNALLPNTSRFKTYTLR